MATKALTIDQILIQLAETPERLAALTAGVTPAQLKTRPMAGEWSAVEVLAHLRACADLWGSNIVTILTEKAPAWRALDPRTWMEQTNYVDLQFAPSLRAFSKQRAGVMAVLGPAPPKDWSRSATVSGAGPIYQRTVFYYAERMARHERAHVKHIGRLVRTLQTNPAYTS
jgi:hypothetical protein